MNITLFLLCLGLLIGCHRWHNE